MEDIALILDVMECAARRRHALARMGIQWVVTVVFLMLVADLPLAVLHQIARLFPLDTAAIA